MDVRYRRMLFESEQTFGHEYTTKLIANHRHFRLFLILNLDGCKVGLEAAAAAGFVHSCCTHYDQVFTGDESLGMLCGIAALHANGKRLGDFIGYCEEFGHGMKGASEIIGVESGNDDALAHVGKLYHQVNHGLAQKLGFIEADHLRSQVDLGLHLGRAADAFRVDTHVVVRNDVTIGIPLVDGWLEDLHALPGDLRAAQAADQLFALAAEHRTADYFDPSKISAHGIHLCLV